MLRLLCFALVLVAASGCSRAKPTDPFTGQPVPEAVAESDSPSRTSSGDSSVSPGYRPAADKSVHVEGYYRKDGTYVKPHDRAAPGQGRRK
jgi:hypothetical protein